MAIQWGSYHGRARHGVEITMSPTTVTKDTSSVTLTYKVYLQTDRGATPGYSGTYTLNRTGTGPTGSSSVSVYTQGTTPQLLGTWTQNVSTSYSGTVSRSLTVQFATALFDGSRPIATGNFTVPKRPPQLPAQATAASSSYVSNTRIDVSWTRPASASNDSNIWTNTVIQRQASGSSTWSTIATLSGTATSYADTSVSTNQRWRYRVAGKNATGTGTFRETGYVSTAPPAPTNIVATKTGTDIVVTWTDTAAYDTGFDVYSDNGTPALLGSVAAGVTSYPHSSPNPSQTWAYRVKAKADGGRESAYSSLSNVVQLQAPPAAPTLLSPTGVVETGNVTFRWQHNPVDTTAQTSYEIRYRPVGGSFTTIALTHPASEITTPIATDGNYEWQARTKGADPSFSDWSGLATFAVSTPPIATIVYPVASPAHDEPSITVEWSYFQAASKVQSGWAVEIYNASGTRIANGSGTDSATRTWVSPNVLQGLQTYEARVRVRESAGLWSDWETQIFTVEFDPPLEPTMEVAWDPAGYNEVQVFASSDGVAPETVNLILERQIENGDWVTLIDSMGSLEIIYQDWAAPLTGTVTYRASAVSALPSVATLDEIITRPVAGRQVYIGGGPGYAQVVRLQYEVEVDVTVGRERVANRFAGRKHVVESSGIMVDENVSVSGVLLDAAEAAAGGVDVGTTRREAEEVFKLPGPHLYRDSFGRYMTCTLSPLRVNYKHLGGVSFTAEHSDEATVEQMLAMAEWLS